jgi:hypothetical protein
MCLTHGLCAQVEAKRAVPRSEVSRDTGGPPKLGVAAKPAGGSTAGSTNPPGSGLASPSQTQIQNESRHALDARINMDEYAYNKIFVGGLHYDTRDGKITSSFILVQENIAAAFCNVGLIIAPQLSSGRILSALDA